MDDDLLRQSEAYLDRLFGAGAGRRHSAFLDRIQPEALREAMHRCHVLEADSALTPVENYLLGMSVLLAQRCFGPAAMFAKTLLHLGVPREKVRAAVARLAMWVGPIPAAEASGHIERAIREWDERGLASMEAWFPR